MQMVSPVDIANTYYGWQVIGRDDVSLRSEIAAAFVDKGLVDEMVQALYAAGFITVGVESRALALTRFIRMEAKDIDINKPYLLVAIDNAGIDFLVMRKGLLYFEYTNQWADLTDEKGQISTEKFEESLAASLRQVVNFYTQHWPDPPAGIILSATAFREEALRAIGASAALPVVPIVLAGDMQISPEWFVAFGCGLRGLNADIKDKEINLSGEGALNTFHHEQLLHFMDLWRVVIPVVLGFLIVVLFLADSFLASVKASVESNAISSLPGTEAAQVAALEASSTVFNQSVSLVSGAEKQISRNYLMIAEINNVAAANGVTIDHISFQAANTPILVSGDAMATAQIAAFTAAIQQDKHFGTVTLSPLNIQQSTQGGYSFSISFPLSAGF
jgi:hypothetical protein